MIHKYRDKKVIPVSLCFSCAASLYTLAIVMSKLAQAGSTARLLKGVVIRRLVEKLMGALVASAEPETNPGCR
jgi:hypothetical protein